MATWIWIVLALLYIISPYDLLPDFIPIRGWIDDGVVVALLYRYLSRLVARRRNAARAGETKFQEHQEQHENVSQENSAKNPYDILGVAPGATKAQIHKAYLQLVQQYHPDKVAHLGREFQELAEERFKEIQQAYQQITNA